jgi:acetylcholinesterase/cholinesterase
MYLTIKFTSFMLMTILTECYELNVEPEVCNVNFGSHEKSTVYAYYGIPFGVPPIGELRFLRPKSLGHSWIEKYRENKFQSNCLPIRPFTQGNYSEDCLYLNIWTPTGIASSSNKHRKLAVMVFIYGGGYLTGGSSWSLYDGSALSAYGRVIVVTINYRLNVFGNLYADTFDADGNQGLWDQKLALEWIQKNIWLFGGDAREVTLFGVSAGAISIGYHLLAKSENGRLFKRAIFESGAPFVQRYFVANKTESLIFWRQVANELNCSSCGNINTVNENIAQKYVY